MSKWRPSLLNGNLYCIPDVHGRYNELKIILNRILPLRKSEGIKDVLVMLGDYVDRHKDSHKVIDLLIECKKKYGDQFICLMGNHEQMFLNGIVNQPESKLYRFWMDNGGTETLKGYLVRAGIPIENPFTFPRSRILDIIPREHIDFIDTLKWYHKISTEYDDLVFSHAGYCYDSDVQEKQKLIWGNGLFNIAKNAKKFNDSEVPWRETIINGHYGDGPFIMGKYIMLDASYRNILVAMEINTLECYAAKYDKKKLVKVNLGI